jgi:ribosomal protein S18 acetylase RimI-like enzyme
MHIRKLTAKDEILRFLQTDAQYAAYAIGDLEPSLYKQCQWTGAEQAGQLQALALQFNGFQPPFVFLMGEITGLTAIFRLGLRTQQIYLTCLEQHLPAVEAFYLTKTLTPMWRMIIQREQFQPTILSAVIPLSPRHVDELEQLYGQAGADAFSPTQLATGVFFGVRERGQLVAAAGTHLVSPTYRLAAIGNVYTDPVHRGRGYGTAVTSAVVAELFRRGIRQICLNVAQTNYRACHIYEHLGFIRYCPILETLAIRRY